MGPKFRVWAHWGVSPTGPHPMGRHVGKRVGFGSPREGQKWALWRVKKVAKSQKTALLALLGTFGENPDFDRKKGSKKSKNTLFSTGNSVSRPRARNALFGSPSRVSWGEKTPPGPPRNVHRVRKRGLQVPYLRGRQKSEKSRNFAQVSYPPNSPRSLYTLSDFNSGL